MPSLDGGGAERVMVTVANALVEQEHAVDLVLVTAKGDYGELVHEDVRVVDLDASRIFASVPALVRYLREHRPDAMLSTLSFTNVVSTWACRWVESPPRLVLREGKHDLGEECPRRRWTQPRDRPRSLLDQPKLIEDHLPWLPDMLSEMERSPVEDLGLMWRAQHAVFLDHLDEIGENENLRVVRHEDVSVDPFEVFSDLFDWVGLPWSQDIESTVADLTSGDNPTERSERKTPHQYRHRRDSSSIVDVWKERLTREQIYKLKDVTQPTVSAFYDEDSWRMHP
jgi:hypothetical protein